jgi:TrwC relaxase
MVFPKRVDMFTAVAQKNLADAEGYFDEHLAQNDYYAAGEIRPGQWIGAGAERLGLNNAVTHDQFHALCENKNPNDDKRLTLRQEKANQRRVFYDFTCSAPKSVSVLAVTMDDDRLVAVHKEVTRIAFRELETFAATNATARPAIWSPPRSRTRAVGRSIRCGTHTSRCSTPPLMKRKSAGRHCRREACMTPSVTARRFIAMSWRSASSRLATAFVRRSTALKSRA